MAPIRIVSAPIMILALVTKLMAVQPACLVSFDSTLYRVNAEGTSHLEVFSNQPARIIGMTVVPSGVTFTGCVPGDFIAFEPDNNGRLWRIDNVRSGVPHLVLIGAMPASVTSIAFAHGRFFGIGSGAAFHEFSTTTFQDVGSPVDLATGNTAVGGLAFDGVNTWYITNAQTDRLIRESDPPTAANWSAVGHAGISLGNHGIEMYQGSLWAGINPDSRLVIGTFDTQTGVFSQVWSFSGVAAGACGFVTFAPICAADFNRDGVGDFFDYLDFVAAFSISLPAADFNHDGVVDFFDYLDFVQAFSAGC